MKDRHAIGALLTLLLAAAAALPANAEPWTCTMTVQCENIDCFAIDDALQIIAADHEGQLFASSPIGDRPVTRLSLPGTLPATYGSAGAHAVGELLTIAEDGTGMLTSHHSDGPARTITAFGTSTPPGRAGTPITAFGTCTPPGRAGTPGTAFGTCMPP